jgi:putative flippase GtrA
LKNFLARTISTGQRPLKFAIVGMLNTGIDFVTFWILITVTDTPLLVANSIAYMMGILNSFVWNKLWTFGDIEHHHPAHYQFAFTFLVYGIGLLTSNLIVAIFVNFLPPLAAKVVAIFGTVVWTYWASKKYVYKPADVND